MNAVLQQVRPPTLLLAMSAVVFLTLVASYMYGFQKPLAEYLALRQARVQAVEDVALAQQGVQEDHVALTKQRVQALEESLFGKGAHLPPGQMESFVVGQLDHLSNLHLVELLSVKPGRATDVLMFEEVPFDVEVKGKYFDLFAWLRDLESELRPMVLKQFELVPAGTDDGLRMTLRVVSYRTREAPR